MKKKEREKGKVEKCKNAKNKKEECIVNYCCNPQYFLVWGNHFGIRDGLAY